MSEQWSLEKINQLINDKVQESLNLEYKSSGALEKTEKKKEEITKDVSAMANSDGGIIIYGIKEYDETDKRYLPEKIDAIDQSKVTKEWLEQVIGNIQPKVDGIIITPINVNNENSVVYVVDIPKGDTAHQAQDRKYYKRNNFFSEPMHDYEIRDIMGRNKNPKIELSFIFQPTARSGDKYYHKLIAKAINIGSVYAKYVVVHVEIPSFILLDKDKKHNPTFFWKVENTIRDQIIEEPIFSLRSSGHRNDAKISESPPRYVPILPGLDHEWDISLCPLSDVLPSGRFSEESRISWKIYADNAMPRIGETLCNEINIGIFKEPPHA